MANDITIHVYFTDKPPQGLIAVSGGVPDDDGEALPLEMVVNVDKARPIEDAPGFVDTPDDHVGFRLVITTRQTRRSP